MKTLPALKTRRALAEVARACPLGRMLAEAARACPLAGKGAAAGLLFVGLLAGSAHLSASLAAQEEALPTGAVVGMVYDSTAGGPLAGETIALI